MVIKKFVFFIVSMTLLTSLIACTKTSQEDVTQPSVSTPIEVANFSLSDLIELRKVVSEALSLSDAKFGADENQIRLADQAEILMVTIQPDSKLTDVVANKTEQQRLILDILKGIFSAGAEWFYKIPSPIAGAIANSAEELGNKIAEWQVLGQLSYAKITSNTGMMEIVYHKSLGEVWASFDIRNPAGQLVMYIPIEPILVSPEGSGNILLSKGVKPILEKCKIAYHLSEVPTSISTPGTTGMSAASVSLSKVIVGDFSVVISSVERTESAATLRFAVTKVGNTGSKGGTVKIALTDDHNNSYQGTVNILPGGSPDNFLALVPIDFTYVVSTTIQIPKLAPIVNIQLGEAKAVGFKDVQFVKPSFKQDFGIASIKPGAGLSLGRYLTFTIKAPASDVIGWILPVAVSNSEYNPLSVDVRIGLQFPSGQITWNKTGDIGINVPASGKVELEPRIITLSQGLSNPVPTMLLIHYSDKSAQTNLKVMAVTSGQFPPMPERIAFDGPGSNAAITLVRSDGSGKPTVVSVIGFSPDWSPAGNKIAISAFGTMYIIAADGAETAKLPWSGGTPRWSPDGKRIAFSDSSDVIKIGNADGSGVIQPVARVMNSNYPYSCYNPDWSPDGSRLVYDSYFAPYKSGIYIVPSNGTGTPTLLVEGEHPAWSPNSETIAFEYKGDIYKINTDGTGKTKVVGGNNPAWSPDGKRLAFDSEKNIYVINADGSGKIMISKGDNPSWGPAFKLN